MRQEEDKLSCFKVYHYIYGTANAVKLYNEGLLYSMQNTLPFAFPTSPAQLGSFSGHETFTFRYAWLKKGLDGLLNRPDLFQSDEAMVELGVGKNMVRSIRHWCLATGVLEEGNYLPQSRVKRLAPSVFGTSIFHNPGYDPYLEDDATLWLLHWHLANNATRATTWHWAFNLYKEQDFTRDTLLIALKRVVADRSSNSIAEASLKADIACFLRTYIAGKRGITSTLEETLDCPLTNLKLIVETVDEGHFRFVNGHKPSLPTGIFLYALLDFWEQRFSGQKTLSMRQIVYGEGGPGRVFRLDDDATLRHLDRLEGLTNSSLRFSDTVQQRQVTQHRPITKEEALRAYYTA